MPRTVMHSADERAGPTHGCDPFGMEPTRALQRLSPMTTWMAPVVASLALAATACSSPGQDSEASPAPSSRLSTSMSPSPERTGTSGTISGRLLLVGGPSPDLRATSGTVKLHGPSATQGAADRHGRFEVAATPGTYRITGTSPNYGNGRYLCEAAHPVVVVAAETRHVNVYCQMR